MERIYDILAIPKPRMTRADKWKKRDCVQRYYAFKDACREVGMSLPDHSHVIFVMPMPKSWSVKKRAAMLGQKHESKPDYDNLAKALGDALYDDDKHLSDIRATKVWGMCPRIIIRPMAAQAMDVGVLV